MPSVNRVVLVGTLAKGGVELRYVHSGTACASFTLVLTEVGADGKDHSVFVPCECWGKKAEAAGELAAGQLACFEDKLRRRQKADQSWELVVSGYEVMAVGAVPTTVNSPN
jgi:single-stranded DNA-binding protein